ncbi:MAG: hypothetical protein ACE3JP_07210 [Ectobacillus sp.]
MKRLAITVFILLIGYAMFYDITVGTLPLMRTEQKAKPTATQPKETTENASYKVIEVKSGDTVLSIVEQISKRKPPSVEMVVKDFQKLNPKESPSKLRIGKSYKFPSYN